jgi:hypothetical protein
MLSFQSNPDDPDDTGILGIKTPSQLRDAPDDDLFKFWRKLAFGGKYPFDRMVEMEIRFRHIKAMKTSSRRMEILTGVIVVLTVALVVLTGVLAWREIA